MATGNAGAAALNNSASDPQQQSKPHLPKNAHITGNYFQSQMLAEENRDQQNYFLTSP
jgi:hypothetical protein